MKDELQPIDYLMLDKLIAFSVNHCVVNVYVFDVRANCLVLPFSVSQLYNDYNLLDVSCCFLAFDFCRFCVVNRFFHPHHNGQ